MSYTPTTDFLALLRQTSGGMRFARTPGLDYLIAGLARAGMFLLWTGAAAPTVNKAITVWLQPAQPSWTAEGAIFLYNTVSEEFEPATPTLWTALFTATAPAPTVFQSVIVGAGVVANLTTLLAVLRINPVTTVLTLPSVFTKSQPLQIVDWSSAVINHEITLEPATGDETIMQLGSFRLLSTADQLAGVTLYPSINLSGWVIAP